MTGVGSDYASDGQPIMKSVYQIQQQQKQEKQQQKRAIMQVSYIHIFIVITYELLLQQKPHKQKIVNNDSHNSHK